MSNDLKKKYSTRLLYKILRFYNYCDLEIFVKCLKQMVLINKNLRKATQDKTIGIILCKKDNKLMIKYCSDERIKIREY